ncbi:hypothetical protein HGRIS_005879 [Hohenbuehelia grisea]|uniref:DUF6533 domain-containing protein n=1 Tax=Hohenbuehelia grisea TaxID=104357 RepID=A0ABR3JZ20_9AGAR
MSHVPDIVSDIAETIRTNKLTVDQYVGFASFTVLIWDHVDTFADEVEYIWKGKKGPIVYLFFINRYFTPLGFIINLFVVDDVRSILNFHQKKLLLKSTPAFLAVPHNPGSGVHACSMIFDPEFSVAASSSAWFPLMYDSIVLALTLHRTFPSVKRREAGFILRRLLEDGLLYYAVIFSVTLVLTIMIIAAPPGGFLSASVLVAMMSRITLNLKKAGRHADVEIIAGTNWLDIRRREEHTWNRVEYNDARSHDSSSPTRIDTPPSVTLHKRKSAGSSSSHATASKASLRRSPQEISSSEPAVPPALAVPPSAALRPHQDHRGANDLAGIRFLTPTASMISRASFTPPATPAAPSPLEMTHSIPLGHPSGYSEVFETQPTSTPAPGKNLQPTSLGVRSPDRGPPLDFKNAYQPPEDW